MDSVERAERAIESPLTPRDPFGEFELPDLGEGVTAADPTDKRSASF